MQCPTTPIFKTSVEQKRHAQNIAKQQRLGTPKLRDLLREKCRIRIINARKDCIDGNRKMQLCDFQNIIHEELKELEEDVELEQHIFNELLSDVNEWYALQEQHLETLYTEPNEDPNQLSLLCPVCLLKPLQRIKSRYTCQCGVQFEHAADKAQLEKLLKQKIDEHEVSCTEALGFFIETLPNSGSLFAICGSCDYCCSV